MTASPFARIGTRLAVLNGATDDHWCLADGTLCRSDVFLHRHLCEAGFERIAFVSHEGIYFLDDRSARGLMEPERQEAEPKPRRATRLAGAPGGLTMRRRAQADAQPARRLYRGLQDTAELVPLLKRALLPTTPRTAVVVHALGWFFEGGAGAAAPWFRETILTEFLANASPANRNLLLFRFAYASSSALADRLAERNMGWLFAHDSQGGLAGKATLVTVGSPWADEIEPLVDRARLLRGLEVDWAGYPTNLAAIAGHTRGEGMRLADVECWLSGLERLDEASVSRFVERNTAGTAIERLERLEGLDEVKAHIEQLRGAAQHQILEVRPGGTTAVHRLQPPPPPSGVPSLHLVLLGNPGTGKTTVAQLMGEIYRDIGLLPSGHLVIATRADLVAQYVGQSAPRTRDLVQRAMGGVLFIDEAYDLCRNDEDEFGREALTELLVNLSAHDGAFACVLAGYPRPMQNLLSQNEGLSRRLATRLTLHDLEPQALRRVFEQRVASHRGQLELEPALQDRLDDLFAALYGARDEHWGNAGAVITIADKCIQAGLARGSRRIDTQDVPDEHQPLLEPRAVTESGLISGLDELIGLTGAKQAVQNIFARLQVEQRRRPGARVVPGHFVFTGNAGTGKTTVADMMAEQLFALGVFTRRTATRTTAPALEKGYLSQTKENTRAFLESGLGGVIFIDEAHQLAQSIGSGTSLGREAIDALVPFAEDHRGDCCIILAGYPGPMANLLSTDQGISGRFANHVHFDDYDASELREIYSLFCAKHEPELRVHPDAEGALLAALAAETGRPGFANARSARNLFERCITNQALRLVDQPDADVSELCTLRVQDIPGTGVTP